MKTWPRRHDRTRQQNRVRDPSLSGRGLPSNAVAGPCRLEWTAWRYRGAGRTGRQGKALLAALKAGDTVITAKLDRMFRSALDALAVLGQLKDRGVSLHMIDLGGDVTGNGISKLVFTILSAVAEAERDRIRERVATVKADQRQRGRYLGGKVPFGFRVDEHGALEPDSHQQDAIATARRLHADRQTMRAIQASLAADGHKVALSALHRVLHAS
jgi:putative DNA-invertase from lambdoid prophage Rac